MSPKNETENEAQREARRWQILLAGLRVFGHKGFAATGMKDIAEAAGVSYGLAYHYFASKDELFGALVGIALDTSLGLYRKAASLDASPDIKIRRIVEGVLAAMDDTVSPLFFMLMIQAATMAGLPEAVRRLFSERLAEYDTILQSMIEEGQRLGTVRPGNPKAHCVYLTAFFQGLAVERSIDPEAPLPDAEGILRGILI